MDLENIINALDLKVLSNSQDFSIIKPTVGYTSDLLSCVMTGATHGGLWITLQAHANIVAVAALLELGAVIITENAQPDEATLAKANLEKITLLSTPLGSFEVIGRLWELGVRAS
jgi:hypothetical protein